MGGYGTGAPGLCAIPSSRLATLPAPAAMDCADTFGEAVVRMHIAACSACSNRMLVSHVEGGSLGPLPPPVRPPPMTWQ